MTKPALLICLLPFLWLVSCSEMNPFKDSEILRIPTDTIILANDNVEIACSTCGSGPLTLVFIHGWCIDQTYWAEQESIFCQNYKTVTLDLPGFGKSGKDRALYSIEQYAEDVNTVIKKLNLENVVLIGHSMAGDIILEAKLTNDEVRAIVGVENFKDINEELGDEMKADIDQFMILIQEEYSRIAPAYAEESLLNAQTDSVVKARVLNDIKSADPHISVSCLQAIFDYSPKKKERLSELDLKLFLINSAKPETQTRMLDYAGVNYKLLEISGTGHYPMTEKPRDFNFKLQEILDELVPKEE